MIEQLTYLENIYDLFALCCSYINEMTRNQNSLGILGELENEENNEVYDAIDAYREMVNDRGHKKAFEELLRFVKDYLISGVTMAKCFMLIKYIDDMVEAEIFKENRGQDSFITYNSMNGQYRDKIKIIPKLKDDALVYSPKAAINDTVSLYRDARCCYCTCLDRFLLHYSVWDENLYKKYPFTIYHYTADSLVAKHFKDKKELLFGIIPFTNRPHEEILKIRKGPGKVFSINGLVEGAEEKLQERYKDICEKSREKGVDFLIFPEMLLTRRMFYSFSADNQNSELPFTINGTIWEEGKNECILSDGSGNEIFSYYKKEPFMYEDKKTNTYYRERLDITLNKEYKVLEIDSVGRVGIAICKDLINEDVKMFHKYMKTNLLMVPAYSPSMDIQSGAEDLSENYHCIVVVANACSAASEPAKINEGRKTGFVSTPAKEGTTRKANIYLYSTTQCYTKCDYRCEGKIIKIKLDEQKMYDSTVSYFISEMPFES